MLTSSVSLSACGIGLRDFTSVKQEQQLANECVWIYNIGKPNNEIAGLPLAVVTIAVLFQL